MTLELLKPIFSVCKVVSIGDIDFAAEFIFLSKTDDEMSLVCPTEAVPQGVLEEENDWKAFKIAGVLDFGMVGVIAKISSLLADHNISIFVISTYNTDYILVKTHYLTKTSKLVKDAGYSL